MIVDYDIAVRVFESLPTSMQAPTLHPRYIILDAHRDRRLQPFFFVYQENQAVFYHAFHRGQVLETDLSDIQSPYGYGGPIINNVDPMFHSRAWKYYVIWCQQNQVLAEFIRFHPLVENENHSQGVVLRDRETIWMDLLQEDLMVGYQIRVRTAIRKALNQGVRIEWWSGESFREIYYSMYCKLMDELQADIFYRFPYEYFEMMEWEQTRCAVCLLGDEVVGGGIFLCGPEIMEYHLSVSTTLGKKFSVTNLMLHEAAILGKKLGCAKLHLGGGTNSQEDNKLLFFKAGFSPNRASYHIGKNIYDDKAYDTLQKKWLEKEGSISNNVLFYRT